MTATTITERRTPAERARIAATRRKSTPYGRAVWRALKAMQETGPWEFGPRVSERVFKK